MALKYSPSIVRDGLVMCLDPSQNKSYPTTDLPVKDGLIMWMDASDDTTFSYSSGTTVSQWRDKSGFNYHMVPVSAGPTRNAFLNSRKVLAFTNTQDIQNLSIDLRTSAYSVFVVDRYTSPSSGTGRILTSNSGLNNWLLGHWASEVNKYYANGWIYSTYVALDTNWKLYLGDWGGPSNDLANFYGAGTAIATNSADAAAGPWGLGINANSGERSNCEAAEIIVFNRLLTATERRLVHTYLGQKWGILNADRSIIDLSGLDDTGLLGNGTTADMPAFDFYNKGSLKLDGSTDYIAVPNSTTLNPSTVTVSLWVKRNGYQSSVASYLRRNYNDSYAILGDIAADNVRFRIYNGSSYPESPNANLPLNTWTNIVGTYDLANIKIYKDGVFVGQTAHTSAISYSSSNTTMTIGRDDPASGRFMNANYGSVLIYNRALSAAEILQNYEAQKSRFANTIVQQGLILNLDADNPYSYAGAGTTWYDVSGNGYQATMSNLTSANWVSYNGVRTFETNDTNDQGFRITSFPFPASRTYEIWINSKSFSLGWQTWFDDGGGERILFGTSTNTVHVYPDLNFTANLTTGTWYQLVYTLANGTGSACVAYVNGVSIGSGTYNSTIATSGTLYILGDFSGEVTSCYCALARIYNRALSAAEVLQNYNATKGRFGL